MYRPLAFFFDWFKHHFITPRKKQDQSSMCTTTLEFHLCKAVAFFFFSFLFFSFLGYFLNLLFFHWTSQVALVIKNSPANAGDVRGIGSIPGWGRSPGRGHGNPFQYSCLENPMDREVWQAKIHMVPQSQTRLKRLYMHACSFAHLSLLFSTNPGSSMSAL